MYCEKCGKQLPENAVFCQNCGTKIAESPQESEVDGCYGTGMPAASLETSSGVNVEATVLSKNEYFQMNPSDEYKKRTKISKALYIASIVCSAILLILSSVVVIKVLNALGSAVGYGVNDVKTSYAIRLVLAVLLFAGEILLGLYGIKKLKSGMLFGFLVCLFFEVCLTVPYAIGIPAINVLLLVAMTAMAVIMLIMTSKSNKEYKKYCLEAMQKIQ